MVMMMMMMMMTMPMMTTTTMTMTMMMKKKKKNVMMMTMMMMNTFMTRMMMNTYITISFRAEHTWLKSIKLELINQATTAAPLTRDRSVTVATEMLLLACSHWMLVVGTFPTFSGAFQGVPRSL